MAWMKLKQFTSFLTNVKLAYRNWKMNFVNILIHFYSVGIVIFTIAFRSVRSWSEVCVVGRPGHTRGFFLKYQLLLQTNILVKHFFYLNKLNYEKHIQTSNLTIYYDNKDLYVYYIINIYTKLQTNEGWNSNRNFRCGRNTRWG